MGVGFPCRSLHLVGPRGRAEQPAQSDGQHDPRGPHVSSHRHSGAGLQTLWSQYRLMDDGCRRRAEGLHAIGEVDRRLQPDPRRWKPRARSRASDEAVRLGESAVTSEPRRSRYVGPAGGVRLHLAVASITTSLDHLRTVAQVVQTALIPAFALMSLLRTGHECALVGEWLLEPSITDEHRIARGVGSQISDYDERRKFEDAVGRPPPARGQLAAERLSALLRDASARGYTKDNAKGMPVAIAPLPSTIDLFDRFETTTARTGSWLYRYYSGFAHGKQWAITLGGQRQGPSDQHGHTAARVDANDVAIITTMTLATDAALRAVSSYTDLRSTSSPVN